MNHSAGFPDGHAIEDVYIINLAASTVRWRDLQPLLDVMPFPRRHRFEGIDGAALGDVGISALQADGRLASDLGGFDAKCRAGEIGCALSHAGVLADIVRRELPTALIIEDDIALASGAATWPARFRAAMGDLPPLWDIWYLYRCFDVEHRAERLSPRTVVPWTPQGGAAYAVTLAGAKALLAALTPVSSAVDRVYAKLVQQRQVSAFAASPMLIIPGDHPSVINRDNPSKKWVDDGVNRPPEYWPVEYLAHLGEVASEPAPVRRGPRRLAAAGGSVPRAASAGEFQRVFLVVWWFDRFGGMERHVTDLALALGGQGIVVTVFSERPLPRDNRYGVILRAAGIKVVAPSAAAGLGDDSRLYRRALDRVAGWRAVAGHGGRDRLCAPSTYRLLGEIERAARAGPPCVVHVHGCRLGQRKVLQWAAARRIPSVYTEHLTISDWGGPDDAESPEIFAQTADALACVSNRSRDSLRAALPAPLDIYVMRHIVDDPHPEPSAAPPNLTTGRSEPVRLLAVGRLAAHKGYATLIRALARLRDDGVYFRLRIAGDGAQRAELETLSAGLGLGGAVTFLGAVVPEGIADLWRTTDIAVWASLTEGLPLSIVEAMAQGKTIVATSVGGVPEVINDGVNGLLAPADDAVALAASLRRVILDPELAGRLAAVARRDYEAGGWSREAVIAQTLKTYAGATRRRAARSDQADAAKRASHAVAHVCMLVWRLAAMGMMEARIARQAALLARGGVDVAVFLERPARPFNGYVRAMRRAGVRVVMPSWRASLTNRLAAWLGGRGHTPLERAIAAAFQARRPDAVHIHGWRAGQGWSSLARVLRLAATMDIPTHYSEHAAHFDGAPADAALLATTWPARAGNGGGDVDDGVILAETVALYRWPHCAERLLDASR